MKTRVKIFRGHPDVSAGPRYDVFFVPIPGGEKWTAMDVLDYIQRRLDPTIAYFRHSACCRGLCLRCAARIDGRPSLLCDHVVEPGRDLVLEPISAARALRDLVCRPGFDKAFPRE